MPGAGRRQAQPGCITIIASLLEASAGLVAGTHAGINLCGKACWQRQDISQKHACTLYRNTQKATRRANLSLLGGNVLGYELATVSTAACAVIRARRERDKVAGQRGSNSW